MQIFSKALFTTSRPNHATCHKDGGKTFIIIEVFKVCFSFLSDGEKKRLMRVHS